MKAFRSEQYKEIEETNRMGKTRDPSRKLEITRKYFMQDENQKKDRKGMDLTEADDFKKR